MRLHVALLVPVSLPSGHFLPKYRRNSAPCPEATRHPKEAVQFFSTPAWSHLVVHLVRPQLLPKSPVNSVGVVSETIGITRAMNTHSTKEYTSSRRSIYQSRGLDRPCSQNLWEVTRAVARSDRNSKFIFNYTDRPLAMFYTVRTPL